MKVLFLSLLCFLLFPKDSHAQQPLNDIVERTILKEKPALTYAPIRESDIMWERRIWRLIDVREKMNHAFNYPEAPFFQLLTELIETAQVQAYSTETDDFSIALNTDDLQQILFQTDTIRVYDPETQEPTLQVINNSIFYEDIKRFRLQELWYFDQSTSTMRVRILGIAPLLEVKDEFENVKFEKPLFWLYYPELREELAHHEVFNDSNDHSRMSWEDLFEMRRFASVITKRSNILDERLQDQWRGVDLLLEADKVKREIFNFEHDVWSY
ncbi:MAG: gliding motility protein GldN [Saprospiraceae bacterium]